VSASHPDDRVGRCVGKGVYDGYETNIHTLTTHPYPHQRPKAGRIVESNWKFEKVGRIESNRIEY